MEEKESVREKEEAEELEEKPAPEEVLEEEPDISEALSVFMEKTGQSKQQALAFLLDMMRRMNVSPERDLERARRVARTVAEVFRMIPDSPGVAEVKRSALSAGLASAFRQFGLDPDERTAKILERMMPYLVLMPLIREMAAPQRHDHDPALARLEERLRYMEEKLKEKPIEELSEQVAALRKELEELKSGKRPEEGKVDEVKQSLEDLKKKLLEKEEQEREDRIVKTLESLQKRLEEASRAPPQERRSLLKEIAEEVSEATEGLLQLKDSLERAGLLKEEEVTTKTGQLDYGKLIQRVLRIAEDYIKNQRRPAREEVRTVPVVEQPPAQEAPQEAPPEPQPEVAESAQKG